MHGLVAKLWSNNEQGINSFNILWILSMHLCLHLNFKYINQDLKDINT
jgi:hypothetical protein